MWINQWAEAARIVSESLHTLGVKENTVTQLIALLESNFGSIQNAEAIAQRLAAYKNIIRDVSTPHTEDFGDDFNLYLADGFKPVFWDITKTRRYFQKHLNNKTIIDLCSPWTGEHYRFALELKPKQIVYVDKFNKLNLDEDPHQAQISMDALTFASLLPDNSVNYSMSGIDDIIINSHNTANMEYLYWLQKEIFRTLQLNGLFFWYSNDHAKLLAAWLHNTLEDLTKDKDISSYPFLYQKK